MKLKIGIEGMSCMHCVKHVNECLNEIEGIGGVQVNLEEKSAIVEMEKKIDEVTIKNALDDYGYQAVSFKEI